MVPISSSWHRTADVICTPSASSTCVHTLTWKWSSQSTSRTWWPPPRRSPHGRFSVGAWQPRTSRMVVISGIRPVRSLSCSSTLLSQWCQHRSDCSTRTRRRRQCRPHRSCLVRRRSWRSQPWPDTRYSARRGDVWGVQANTSGGALGDSERRSARKWRIGTRYTNSKLGSRPHSRRRCVQSCNSRRAARNDSKGITRPIMIVGQTWPRSRSPHLGEPVCVAGLPIRRN
jgi:hypothetical protein